MSLLPNGVVPHTRVAEANIRWVLGYQPGGVLAHDHSSMRPWRTANEGRCEVRGVGPDSPQPAQLRGVQGSSRVGLKTGRSRTRTQLVLVCHGLWPIAR